MSDQQDQRDRELSARAFQEDTRRIAASEVCPTCKGTGKVMAGAKKGAKKFRSVEIEVDQRIVQTMREQGDMSYPEAITFLFANDPELYRRYCAGDIRTGTKVVDE